MSAILIGGKGDDVLAGGRRDDRIVGGSGNDTLSGNGGRDKIDGGGGNDTISGGAGNDELEGGSGNDTLSGDAGNDEIGAGDGNDTILWKAGDGNDVVHGGHGTDTLVVSTSESVEQTVRIDAGSNGRIIVTVDGVGGGVLTLKSIEDLKFVVGSGGARIVVGPGVVLSPLNIAGSDAANVIDQSGTTQSAVIDAGAGDDVVLAGDAADTIGGGAGEDHIDGGGGADTIDAGTGDDEVLWSSGDGNDTVQGGEGNDELQVSLTGASSLTVGADAGNVVLVNGSERVTADGIEDIVINAAAGGSTVTIGSLAGTDVLQDTLFFVGGAGADVLDGSATDRRIEAQGDGGSDTLLGGSAGDSLDGGADDDTLQGNGGADVLDGGAGNDTIDGGSGDDTLQGGDGSDTVDYSVDPTGVTVNLLAGTAADGFGGTDTLLGIENANGSELTDTLSGGDGANVLVGLGGNDTLRGNAGADAIDGGAGDDSITGGAGDDTLTGGAGADRYFLVDAGQTVVDIGNDTIADFAADDVIDLTPAPSITSLAQLLAVSRQDGADTVIELGGGNSIRLSGSALGSLTAANFVFTTPIGGTANADFLQGTAGNDAIFGLGGADALLGRAGSDVLDGGDGVDAAFYLGDAGSIIANLSAAAVTVGGVTVESNTVRDSSGNTDTLISIEGVLGTNQADTLIGSAGSNTLSGAAGADTIDGGDGSDIVVGGAGIDSLDGGAGFDIVGFTADPAPLGSPLLQITVNADGSITSTNTLNGEIESGIVNFELVIGSLGNDTITGSAGNDFLGGSFGSDVINGGAGIDTAVYTLNPGTVHLIDLASGTSQETFTPPPPPGVPPPGTFTAADTLISIENVIGSAAGETILGNHDDNVLEGGAGNDLLYGGGGNDTLNGGASVLLTHSEAVIPVAFDGIDTVDYSTDPSGVTVNLLTGTATDGFGDTDTLLSIENANGSSFADTITGNDSANVLAGLGGNDMLRGDAGADTIDGGAGDDSITGGVDNDILTGGGGADRYLVVDAGETVVNIGNDTITDFAADDVIDLTPVPGITSFAQVLALSHQEGADTIVDLGGGHSIRLAGVALGSLTPENFGFEAEPIVGTANMDVLVGTAGKDTILGLGGDDVLQGLGGSDTLDGGDGRDTAFYNEPLGGGSIIANLSASAITVGGVTVQPGTVRDSVGNTDALISIEGVVGSNLGDTLIGGAGADTLSGSGGADTIDGGAGNDLVTGGAGIDSLDGGAGFDIAFFGGDPAPLGSPSPFLQITMNADGSVTSVNTINGETETDIVNFEMVLGSLGNDTVTGSNGNDFLGGGFGNDVVNGGAGIDTAVYTFNPGAVLTIDLASGTSFETFTVTGVPPGAPPLTFTATDTLIGIENVRGSASGETIIGSSGDNVLEGGAGNDVLRGGAGNDTLGGGASVLLTHPEAVVPFELDGTDTADYATDPAGVTVNLLTGTATDGFGNTDTLISIENANGSSFNDTVTGSDAANVLSGLGGNDTLRGNAGADTIDGGDGDDSITGGAGDDTLTGGTGADRYLVVDSGQSVVDIGNDTITDFVPGDSIDLTPIASITSLAQVLAVSRQEGADSVIDLGGGNSIRLTGVALGSLTAASFVFAGSPGFPPGSIVGTEGNDQLQGTPLENSIFGLGGNDTLIGQAGSDLLDGGDGTDTALYLSEPGPIIANLSSSAVSVGAITVQPGTVRDGAGSIDTLINVENITLIGPASSFADTLIGDAGANVFGGGGGADTIFGGDGLDTINGGAGIDILDGGAGFDIVLFGSDPIASNAPGLRITVNADGSITSVGATETEANLLNFEMLSGSQGNDIITGNAGNNMLGGGFGSDLIDGGAGIDTVNYQFSLPSAGSVLTVDLAAGTSAETLIPPAPPGIPPPPPLTASDTLINIENVSGTIGVDHIYGDAGDNVLQGFLGNDVLRGGAGNDTLDGNVFTLFTHLENTGPSPLDGSDTADYATDPNGVNVDLSTGVATDGFGDTDTLVSIENVTGSAFGDTVAGDGGANVLAGLGGNDTLRGNEGADTIDGGAGDDSITGGAGNDTLTGGAGADRYFIVDPGETAVDIGTDTITDFVAGDAIDLTPVPGITSLAQVLAVSHQEGADSVIDLGGGSSIRLTGVALGSLTAANFVFASPPGFPPGSIVGTEGNELLQGTPLDDLMFGLGGNDTLIGNAGSDLLDGGAGTDGLIYLSDAGPIIANLSAAPITVGAITVQPNTVRDGAGSIDTLVSIENISLIGPSANLADTLIGSAAANALSSGGGADTIFGGGGADVINGGTGLDVMDGGDGFDTLSFGSELIPANGTGVQITVNADGSITFVGPFETEANLPNFELVSGTLGNDTVTGNSGDNFLSGSFGSDIIDGGAGVDTVVYQFNFPVPIPGIVHTIDLASGTSAEFLTQPVLPLPGSPPTQILTSADTLIGIENVRGSLGVDNLYGDAGDNVLEGFFGDDLLRGGAGNDTLDGGASSLLTHPEAILSVAVDGTDTADYSTDIASVDVDLSTGVATDGFGGTDTLRSIENATGSAFADTITGNDAANVLAGLGGADTLNGGGGDDRLIGGIGVDVIDGGAGFDIVDYSADAIAASAPGLHIAIDGTTVSAVNALGEVEVATNVEAVVGSLGDDVVTGGDGDDTYIAGAGDDQFDGGGGSDTVRFDTAVVVDLAVDSVQGVNGSLVLANVENVTASASADTLRGSGAANVLIGGLGDDVLAGRGGADTLIGGTPGVASTDVDTVDYSEEAAAVTVNLATGTAIDGGGDTDTLLGIERVIGSNFADTLIGDGGNNMLTGLGGDDLLTGGAGADTFVTTADALGNATFGNDVVTDFNVAQDIVSLRPFVDIGSFAEVQARLTQVGADAVLTVSPGNTVRLENVNAADLTANNFLFLNLNIIGTEAAETLTGDVGNDTIQGRGGNDTLNGLAGNDTLDGGAGFDTLNGGAGNDTLIDADFNTRMIGGAGDDTINGATPYYGADPSGIVANLSTASLDVNGDGSLVLGAHRVRDGYGDIDTIAANLARIEASYFDDHVVGSAATDNILLFAGDDRAFGMDGNDTIFGSSGDDYMDGGAGTFDILDYASTVEDGGPAAPSLGVRLNLSSAPADIGGGVVLAANSGTDTYGDLDSVFNFELVQGSRFGDVIVGGATSVQLNGNDGDDTLLGGSGNDTLNGSQGNDIIDGGAGFDNVSYGGSTGAVVNLLTQTATDGLGGTDVIRNVEAISGGQFADDFTGDDSNSSFVGNAGNDVLRGLGGSDFLDGGDGNDVLDGGAGDDQLYGGRNDDTLTGGAGQDLYSFFRTITPTATDFGVDTITDFSVADDTLNVGQVPELTTIDAVLARATENPQGVLISINAANSIQLNGLTLADLPQMRFFFAPIIATPGDDVLDGGNSNDFINGLGGNDIINGRGGSDVLDGGDGNDTLNGGDGDDTLSGGSGDDTLTGGAGSDAFRSSVTQAPAGYGRDVIIDFAVAEDRLDLSSIASMTSRDALNAASAQVNVDVVITIDPTSAITLRNFTLEQLAAANVTFAPFNGTPGNDVLNGSSGSDFINGLGGADIINGNGGNDTLFGGDGDDLLNGSVGTDSLVGQNGNDTLDGGADYDNLDGGAGDDTVTGGTDSGDFFRASIGRDVITDLTPGGSDFLDLTVFPTLTSSAALAAAAAQVGPDVVITIDPNNTLTLRNFSLAQLNQISIGFAPLNGTPGNDDLDGTASGEMIRGLGGDDVIDGNGGNDQLFGDEGNDTLNGDNGGDQLYGGDGDDILDGGADGDYLDGGAGNDTLTGGAANDLFLGGAGHDVVIDFSADGDVLELSAVPSVRGLEELLAISRQEGPDVVIEIAPSNSLTLRNLTLAELADAQIRFATILGTPGNDTLDGTSSPDNFNAFAGDDIVNGLAGNDSIFGQEGSDALFGGADNDFLVGGAGNDELRGDDGHDQLDGSAGDDRLTGGADSDTFRITSTDGSSYGHDVITDFITADDVLDLSQVPTMTTRAALTNAAAQSGNDVVVTLDSSSSVTIQNFTLAQLATATVFLAPFYGTEGNDILNGSDAGDSMQAFGGDDVVNGNGGGDSIYGGAGNDTLDGGDGSDFIVGENGNDTLLGGAEHDWLEGSAGDDILTGGAGNDTFRSGIGRDTVTQFVTAEDTLDLSSVPSMTSASVLMTAAAQDGADVVITIDADNTITIQNFTLAQLAAANVSFAPLIGTDADETLEGSANHDAIFGRGGDDVLNGEAGDDGLFGENGNDTLNGSFGFDGLNGGLGNDTLNGGPDSDYASYIFAGQTHGAVVDLLTMTALDDGAGGVDSLIGIENVYGSDFADTLTGDGNSNNLYGGGGNDVLRGVGGNDSLQGAAGDDTLRGDGGSDFLFGDVGDDLFVFATGDGADTLYDFVAGAGTDDVIDLQALDGFDSFDDVLAATTDDGAGNSTIDLGDGNQLTLFGVTESALHADDFLL